MRGMGGCGGCGVSTPPLRMPGYVVTCCYTAQDSCCDKDPRSEAMRAVVACSGQLLIVMGSGRRGGVWSAPHIHTLYTRLGVVT